LKNSLKNVAKTLLKLLISGTLLYLALRKTDLESVKHLLINGKLLWLTGAAIFFIFSKVISSVRLNILLKSSGIYISQAENLKLYLLGMFYNLFLPGGIGGDAYKAYFFNKKLNVPVKKSVSALLFDRISGLLALFALCFIFMVFTKGEIVPVPYVLATCALMIITFFFVIGKWFPVYVPILNITNLQSLIVQLFQVISAWFILKFTGTDTDMQLYLMVFLISSAVAVIPFTIGGVGAREVTFMYASELLGLNLSSSVTLSLLFFVITAIVSFAGSWYVFNTRWIKGIENNHIVRG